MRVEKRIILTKKEYEAIKTAYDVFESDYYCFDGTEDFIDFMATVADERVDFNDFVIEVEKD